MDADGWSLLGESMRIWLEQHPLPESIAVSIAEKSWTPIDVVSTVQRLIEVGGVQALEHRDPDRMLGEALDLAGDVLGPEVFAAMFAVDAGGMNL